MSDPAETPAPRAVGHPGAEPVLPKQMKQGDFRRLTEFLYNDYGINLREGKKTMLEVRILKRLRALKMDSYQSYIEFVMSAEGQKHELSNMLDVVTTHTTSFFRERAHYGFLTEQLLPVWENQTRSARSFNIWSAGCSTGQEPYSFAISLLEFKRSHSSFTFTLEGTDVSVASIKTAQSGIYKAEHVADIEKELLRRYFLKHKDPVKPLVRVMPEVRRMISFRPANLFNDSELSRGPFDLILCRNVIIYFDRPTQQRILSKMVDRLRPGGFLFLGHSESTGGMGLGLKLIGPTVYQKQGDMR